MNWPVTDNQEVWQYGNYQLIENGSEIYLLNRHFHFLLFSDDGGLSWYLYPRSVGDYYNYGMHVERDGRISFVNNTWEGDRVKRKIKKVSLRFFRKE